MSKFSVGQKVAFYYRDGRCVGRIVDVDESQHLLEINDGEGGGHWLHEKQCRRLVKKERKRWWINTAPITVVENGKVIMSLSEYPITSVPQENWIEVVEVGKK